LPRQMSLWIGKPCLQTYVMEDSGHAIIDADLLLCWQDNIRMLLWNPGRIRMRLMPPHWKTLRSWPMGKQQESKKHLALRVSL
jgi:hypothetical protein